VQGVIRNEWQALYKGRNAAVSTRKRARCGEPESGLLPGARSPEGWFLFKSAQRSAWRLCCGYSGAALPARLGVAFPGKGAGRISGGVVDRRLEGAARPCAVLDSRRGGVVLSGTGRSRRLQGPTGFAD